MRTFEELVDEAAGVDRYEQALRRLDARIREHGAFVAYSTRTLIEAKRGFD